MLPLPAREVTNLTIEAALVFKNTPELFERLCRATSSFPDQCRILLRWLESVVEPDDRLTQVRHACSVLARTPQDARVDRIARDMAVSSRHLRRVFLEYVGVTPLEYARLQRFHRALNLMPSDLNLTAIAHESHYYDQAHLCHDFKDIAGITPGEYRAQAARSADCCFRRMSVPYNSASRPSANLVPRGGIEMVQRAALYAAIVVVAGMLGANVYNSVVDAPSWGSAIPASLETARRYFAAGNPGKFYRIASPLGQVALLLVLVVCWKLGAGVRTFAAAALALIVSTELLTVAYFFPRNAIMMTRAMDVAAASRAWQEWSVMNHVRSAIMLAALLCELAALSRFERLEAQH